MAYPPIDSQNQGTFLNTATFPELTDLVNRTFLSVGALIVPVARQLFITENVGANEGEMKMFQEYDTTTYARAKPQGVDAKKAAFGIGYYVTVQQKRVGIESEITFEMRRYNKKAEVNAALMSLANFIPQRIELDLTHVFTFATAVSYVDLDGNTVSSVGGDGLALSSASHTLKFSTLTYSNRISGDPLFSKGALELAELLTTTDILSNFGEKRVMDFNTIVTGNNPTVCNAVKQFLRSVSDNTQTNSGVVNVNQDKYRHLTLPQLATTATGAIDNTKKNWWFLIAAGAGLRGWQAYYVEFEGANLTSATTGNGIDVHKDIWYYNVRGSYNQCFVSGRGLIGSHPTN